MESLIAASCDVAGQYSKYTAGLGFDIWVVKWCEKKQCTIAVVAMDGPFC